MYPGEPSSTLPAKRDTPCWFQGLEILIRLKEGPDTKSVDEPEEKEDREDIFRLSCENFGMKF